ncbi:MAG: IS91 family transposase [Verrucomicrobiota bacterium]
MDRPVAGSDPPRGGVTLAAVLRAGLPFFCRTHRLTRYQWKILRAIQHCRTLALGGHRYRCEACGREHFVPHACRNRHCPLCQGAQARDWLERQEAVLLPIPYFHLVFTLPHVLNPLIRQNQRELYNLLFAAASQTLLQFGRQTFQAQVGVTAVLHTWGQALGEHYHLHCIVTGGGWASDGTGWVSSSPHYLFAVRALSVMFAGKFRAGLEALRGQGKLEYHGPLEALARPGNWAALDFDLRQSKWNVYAKRPFAGPEQVLAYLSGYTHRVAISNRRLQALDETTVTFGYKDYRDGHRRKSMTLALEEFVRRFCLHLLPKRFVKIRHYGLLGNRDRQARIALVREALGGAPTPAGKAAAGAEPVTGKEARQRCPHCGALALIWIAAVPPQTTRWWAPILDSS